MNNHMYEHPATRANLDLLRSRGVHMIEPDSGRLASRGEQGIGRLAEPERLLDVCEQVLAGRTVSGEAGGTTSVEGGEKPPWRVPYARAGGLGADCAS